MIDVYGISESGKKVKVGQVDEGQIVDSGNENFYIGKIVNSSSNNTGTEYVYGFTSDNEKVIIGTVEEAAAGYNITFPSGTNMYTYCTSVSVNGGEAISGSTWASSVKGQTLSGVSTITAIGCGNAVTSSQQVVTYAASPSSADVDGDKTAISSPSAFTARNITMTFPWPASRGLPVSQAT